MRLTRSFLGVTAASVAALSIGGAATAAEGHPPTARQSRSVPLEHTVFTNPYIDSGRQINDELVKLIIGAASGSDIEMTAFDFSDDSTRPVADALAKAHQANGVHVRIVANGTLAGTSMIGDLAKSLKGDAKSWVRYCDASSTDHACIGGNLPGHEDAFMHNKFYLFSDTLGAGKVVAQSSANLSDSSGPQMWNSLYAVSDAGLHSAYHTYFTDLASRKKDADYYHSAHGTATTGRFKVYHAPRGARSGEKQNTAYNILGNVQCTGNTSGGTSDNHRTIIRVAMWQFSSEAGKQIAKRLWDLDKKGCYVDVVAGHLKDGTKDILLKKAGGYHGPEVREFTGSPGLHQKTMLIDGHYAGAKNQKVVFNGSYNFTFKSLRENDETWLRVKSADVHTAFKKNFWTVQCAPKVKTWQATKDPCAV